MHKWQKEYEAQNANLPDKTKGRNLEGSTTGHFCLDNEENLLQKDKDINKDAEDEEWEEERLTKSCNPAEGAVYDAAKSQYRPGDMVEV